MEATPVQGERLTTWSILPGGTQVSLDFVATDGMAHRIVLSVDTLSGLMMTLPRILQSALDERFPVGSFRIVQALENWRLEQQASDEGLILKLGTKDGFEVAFALSTEHASLLGAALVDAPRDIDPILARRVN